MKVNRLTPRSADILCADQEIVHVKISCIHGIHHSIDNIKHVLFLAVGETGRPDSLCAWKFLEIYFFIVCEYVSVQFPVFQISGMVDRDSREPLKSRNCHIVIVAFPADARIRIETRKYWIYNHIIFLLFRPETSQNQRTVPDPSCPSRSSPEYSRYL